MTDSPAGSLFVGRDRELHDLLDALDQAVAGHGRLVLIGGEPGIGKSRLADELANQARSAGHLVLLGRGWEDAGAPPFWLWVQALRAYLRSSEADDLQRHLGSGASDVVQMLPEITDLLPGLPPPPQADADSARFRLFDSTVRWLARVARERPIVLVLDDLQAADTPSILLLRFLASQLADMRVLVVATYRDIEVTPDDPLRAALDQMAREPGTRLVSLTGLDRDAVGRFIGDSAQLTPQDHLVAAIWRETSGNPLFVGEAIRLLSAEGRLDEVADLPSLRITVPAGIRAVIARRIGHLDDASARAISLAAALGPEFGIDVLRRVGGYSADEVLDRVDDAVRSGLIVPVAGVLGRYRFSHDLVRETLDGDLSPGRRARLHRRIGEVLESVFASSLEAHLAELAFHFVEAARGGDGVDVDDAGQHAGRKAIDYAQRAGDQAARSLAYEEADRLYGVALAGLDLTDAPDEHLRTDILLALGEVQARSGDLERSRATYRFAAATAKRTGAADQLGWAALGYGGRLAWSRPGNDLLLIPLLQDALDMVGGEDAQLRVRLLSRLACAWRSSPDRREDSAALSLQAVELARELDDPATLSYALSGRYWSIWWPENLDERHPILKEMLAIVERLGDGERVVDGQILLFMDHSEAGRMAEARAAVQAVTRFVDELRQPAQAFLGISPRAWLALFEGDFDLAEQILAQELLIPREQNMALDSDSAGRMHRFLLRREQDRLVEELESVRESAEIFPWYPMHRAALAIVLLELGRLAEARSVFDDFAQGEFRAFYRDCSWLFGICLAAEACSLLDDAAAAAALYVQLAPFAGRHAVTGAEGSAGVVDRYLGLLAATDGRLDDADAHLTAAIALNETMGGRPWVAHCQHDLAMVLRRRDAPYDRSRAASLDDAARSTARELGMISLLASIVDTASDDVESPAPERPPSTGTFRREGEYWTIAYGQDAFRIRDARGLHHLSRLLGSPGRELHALELARSESAAGSRDQVGDRTLALDQSGDAGPQLDPEARAAYRSRLLELREEIDEASSWNDPERLARLQAESDALAHELAAAFGLGGRARPSASAAERARVSVTRAIRSSLTRIGEHSPALRTHLDATIRTGTFCSYTPDPRAPIRWLI